MILQPIASGGLQTIAKSCRKKVSVHGLHWEFSPILLSHLRLRVHNYVFVLKTERVVFVYLFV